MLDLKDNPILQALNSGSQQSNTVSGMEIMLMAVGAMMRGETPQSFLQNLAKSQNELKGLDLSNPYKTAEKLYSDKGEDINQAKDTLKSRLNNFFK